jgi:predicted DsbA family dithiol-disulfide isomerase
MVRFVGLEAIGVDLALPVTVDVKAALGELAEAAAAEGTVLHEPPALPPTGWAHVVEDLAEFRGLGAAWRGACYRAFWERGVDLSSAGVLVGIAAVAGLPVAEVEAALSERVRLTSVRRRSGALRGEGIGGVPTILAQRTLVPGLLAEADLRALAELG